LVIWSFSDPAANLAIVIAVALMIAIASATQDISVDALRIEQVGEDEGNVMAAGAAVAVVGWWTGFKLGGAATLFLAQWFEQAGVVDYWQATFLVLGLVIVASNLALMFVPEAKHRISFTTKGQTLPGSNASTGHLQFLKRLCAWLADTLVAPLLSFFRRNGIPIALAVLGFIFLFKIGEAFLGRMSIVFYKEIGFSKNDIAVYSKGLGWVTTVAFTILGGLFAVRAGLVRAMFLAGFLMAATNLLFSLLAWSGKSEALFAFAVVMDDLTGAFATVTFVAFISMLVDRSYTATQYALLASIGTAGRTLFASSSGAMVDWLNGDWGLFFIITAAMVTPSLICLWMIRHRLAAMLAGVEVSRLGKQGSAPP
jgi:PAT family beta-lactamase induction signal transducer AmpG